MSMVVTDDRLRRYIKKWLKDGNLGSPPIVRGIDFHNVLPHIQREVVDALTASFRKYTYGPDKLPKTWGDTLMLSSKGLPIHTQDLLHFFCYSIEESPFFGGGKAVFGILPRIVMSAAESGSQVSRERRGYATNQNANLHEWARYNITGACVKDHFEVVKNVDQCFANMDPRMRGPLLEGINEVMEVVLAWEIGKLDSMPELFESHLLHQLYGPIVRSLMPLSDLLLKTL